MYQDSEQFEVSKARKKRMSMYLVFEKITTFAFIARLCIAMITRELELDVA